MESTEVAREREDAADMLLAALPRIRFVRLRVCVKSGAELLALERRSDISLLRFDGAGAGWHEGAGAVDIVLMGEALRFLSDRGSVSFW